MKTLLLLLCAATAYGATPPLPTIVGTTAKFVTHSTAKIYVNLTGSTTHPAPDDGTAGSGLPVYWESVRFRIGPSCESGSGKLIASYYPERNSNTTNNNGIRTRTIPEFLVTGLGPGGTVKVCPEFTSKDLSTNTYHDWTSGYGYNIALAAVPAKHPASPRDVEWKILPKVPATVDSPDGGTKTATCSNLFNTLQTAYAEQATYAVRTIKMAPGTNCNPSPRLFPDNQPPNAKSWCASASINVGGFQFFQINNNYSDGDKVVFWVSGYAARGLPQSSGYDWMEPRGIIEGQEYIVYNRTATQFGVKLHRLDNDVDDPVKYRSEGTDGCANYVFKPAELGKIVIKPDLTEDQMPVGRLDKTQFAVWSSKLITLTQDRTGRSYSFYAVPGDPHSNSNLNVGLFSTKNLTDDANHYPVRNVTLEGVVLKAGTRTDGGGMCSGDCGGATSYLMRLDYMCGDITFDRGAILGQPPRSGQGMFWPIFLEGTRVAIINSFLDNFTHDNYGEGTQGIQIATGPGPMIFAQNWVEKEMGNFFHMNDDGREDHPRGNFYIYRNYLRNGFELTDQNGLFSFPGRQIMEEKSGLKSSFVGNEFVEQYHETAISPLLFTSVGGLGDTDINVESNSFISVFSALSCCISTQGGNVQTPAIARVRINNNIALDVNVAYKEKGNGNCSSGSATYGGHFIDKLNDAEDVEVGHNATYLVSDCSGLYPASIIRTGLSPVEGVNIHDNIFTIMNKETVKGFSREESPTSAGDFAYQMSGQNLVNAMYGPTAYHHNLLLSNSASLATLQTWFDTSKWMMPDDPTNGASVGWRKITGSPRTWDMSLKSDSPYNSGGLKSSDGGPLGIDWVKLQRDQGTIKTVNVSVSGTTVRVAFEAPDMENVSIDWKATNDNSDVLNQGFTRVSETGSQTAYARVLTFTAPSHSRVKMRLNGQISHPYLFAMVN